MFNYLVAFLHPSMSLKTFSSLARILTMPWVLLLRNLRKSSEEWLDVSWSLLAIFFSLLSMTELFLGTAISSLALLICVMLLIISKSGRSLGSGSESTWRRLASVNCGCSTGRSWDRKRSKCQLGHGVT